jgi:hypothetical protein
MALPFRTPDLPHVERDRVRAPGRGGVEVHVIRDEEVARADHRGTALRMERRGTEVGPPRRIGELPLEALVFPLADVREVLPGGIGLRGFIEIDGDAELGAHPFRQPPCQHCRFVQGDPVQRHQGTDVRRPHARVLAAVRAHVDEPGRFADGAIRGLHDGLRCPGEGDYSAIRRLAGVDMQERGPFNLFDPGGNLPDEIEVTSFAEIRDTLEERGHRAGAFWVQSSGVLRFAVAR